MPDLAMPYYPPSRRLRGLVDSIYVLRCDLASLRAPTGALLAQLQWRFSGRPSWGFADGTSLPLSPVTVIGPSQAALTIELAGPTVVAGLGLFPEGWAALFDEPAHRLTGTLVDLTAIWGACAQRPLFGGPDAGDAWIVAAIDALLCDRLDAREARHDDQIGRRIGAITGWANGAAPAIDALSGTLALSHRQLDRLALAACGMPPRVLANKQRTMRIAAAMAADATAGPHVWADDYADQSHFIRNFKRFLGVTPRGLLRPEGMFVASMLRERSTIRSDHALGLYVAR